MIVSLAGRTLIQETLEMLVQACGQTSNPATQKLRKGRSQLKVCLGYTKFKASLDNLARHCLKMKGRKRPGDVDQ